MKIIVALKEPLWRRLLRYGLWALIYGVFSYAVWVTTGILVDIHTRQKTIQRIEQLEFILPRHAQAWAIALNTKLPNDQTRKVLARVAFEAGNYQMADTLIGEMSKVSSADVLGLRVAIASKLKSPNLKELTQRLQKATPSDYAQRYWSAWACIVSEDPALLDTAKRFLAHIENKRYKNRAALLRLIISIKQNQNKEAIERAELLTHQKLPAAEAIMLWGILEHIQPLRSTEYYHSLQTRAKSDPVLKQMLIDLK